MFDLCMDWGSFLRDGLGCYGMRIEGVPNVMSLASNDVDYFMRKRKKWNFVEKLCICMLDTTLMFRKITSDFS